MGQKSSKSSLSMIKRINREFKSKGADGIWWPRTMHCQIYDEKDTIISVYPICYELDIHLNLDYANYKYVLNDNYELQYDCHLPNDVVYYSKTTDIKIKQTPKLPPAYDEVKKPEAENLRTEPAQAPSLTQ